MPLPNPNERFDAQLTFGEKVSDVVAAFGGSWTFIIIFLSSMGFWMLWNVTAQNRFDVFPFIFLNLLLSCLAALQAPIIMMSQNRQAEKDRMDAQHDYEVNTRAELEIVEMRTKIEEMSQALKRMESALLHPERGARLPAIDE